MAVRSPSPSPAHPSPCLLIPAKTVTDTKLGPSCPNGLTSCGPLSVQQSTTVQYCTLLRTLPRRLHEGAQQEVVLRQKETAVWTRGRHAIGWGTWTAGRWHHTLRHGGTLRREAGAGRAPAKEPKGEWGGVECGPCAGGPHLSHAPHQQMEPPGLEAPSEPFLSFFDHSSSSNGGGGMPAPCSAVPSAPLQALPPLPLGRQRITSGRVRGA